MPPEPSRWPHDPPSSLLDSFLSSSIVLPDSLGKELHLLAASFGGCRHVEGRSRSISMKQARPVLLKSSRTPPISVECSLNQP